MEGIGKIVELLNEYDGKTIKWDLNYKGEIMLEGLPGYVKTAFLEVLICSRHYGFIKWLVENNKLKDLENYEYLEDCYGGTFGDDENVIMKLAISKTPIDDLIKLLK